MPQQNEFQTSRTKSTLWVIALFVLYAAMIFARAVYPEIIALTVIVGVLLLGAHIVVFLDLKKTQTIRGKTASYGVNALVTVLLVLGIVGVINFLNSRYPKKWDLTENKLHTLSDQTVKIVKSLEQPLTARYFATLQTREANRAILENYKSLNPKFTLEFIDPVREPTRVKQAGIRRDGTLQISYGGKENKVEEISEEKLTNALIKITQEKEVTLCWIQGHGEKDIDSEEREGYALIKQALSDQSYKVQPLDLLKTGEISKDCSALAIMGPTKDFFEPETRLLEEYLEKGGRAVVALDLNLKIGDNAPTLVTLLQKWHVDVKKALVIEPVLRRLGMDSSVALATNYSQTSPITEDFSDNVMLPLSRPVEVIKDSPPSLSVEWIAKTNLTSWAINDMKGISNGEVTLDPKRDQKGPLTVAVSVEGKQKDSQSKKNTRLVVFGTSLFASNQFGRHAGNFDFFLNSVSWTLEDENLISIRKKESDPGKVDLSEKAGRFIFLLTVVFIPTLTAGGGLAFWAYRRRL